MPTSDRGRRAPSYEIRPLRSSAELATSYQLRYEAYARLGYLPGNDHRSRLDVDEYDTSSIPLGAFDARTDELVGTLRVVATQPRRDYEELIRTIVAGVGDLELVRRVWHPRPRALPSIVSGAIAGELERYNHGHLPVFEMSRCIVRDDRRGEGISRGLVELGMAYAIRPGPAILLGGCLTEHLSMYARYGFRPLRSDGAARDHFPIVGQPAHAVVCRAPDGVPYPTQASVLAIAEAMRAGVTEHVIDLGRGRGTLARLRPVDLDDAAESAAPGSQIS